MRLFFSIILFVGVLSSYVMAQSPNHNHVACSTNKQYMPHFTSAVNTTNSRSDSIDILNYNINLDFSDLDVERLDGFCNIKLKSKQNGLDVLNFDLLNMEVKEVYVDGKALPFQYTSPLLSIPLAQALAKDQLVSVSIYYGGDPIAASFGGFYFNEGYAYNMGVGIGIEPPNFGRAWFPCVDNFVERSTFDFNITTTADQKAFCNGLLKDKIENVDGSLTWSWSLGQEIPTYLASIAVSDFETIEYEYEGAERKIAVELGAKKEDITNVRKSFVHLPNAIEGFESGFGAYQFDRVGFVIVPFGGGAMEHATNITYPKSSVDGTLKQEKLLAHEFAHHWFGNLVTCEKASDMWLNEGWASYCESYFMEWVYGKEGYKNSIRTNHSNVLKYTHIKDNGYHATAPIPSDLTYGSHVYNGGADKAHTLRGYMGDELFFSCLQDYLKTYAFQHTNTYLFRDFLSECSGLDLNDFFDNWIFSAGFPHLSLDKYDIAYNGEGYTATIYVQQRLNNAPHYYNNVPVEITFFDAEMNSFTYQLSVSDACSVHQVELPFFPIYGGLDLEEKISDATIDNYHLIEKTGSYTFNHTNMEVVVEKATTPAFLRVIDNIITPERLKTPVEGLVLSNNHYWTVEGVNTGLLQASATIQYNGAPDFKGGYLDRELITSSENDLVLLYRASRDKEWEITSFAIDIQGNADDKIGSIEVTDLQMGEYVLGIIDKQRIDNTQVMEEACVWTSVELELFEMPNKYFTIRPNPAGNKALIDFQYSDMETTSKLIRVFNVRGDQVGEFDVPPNEQQLELDTTSWEAGIYLLDLFLQGQKVDTEKLLIVK
ncbi:MAG: M1 family aminopeptidase [Chitinophagales bacterium]